MANKNTNMILAVAVIAVCAIAIIGVGYAYTATTDNTGNDSTVTYITLTQGNAEKYFDIFDKKINYDTSTTATLPTPESKPADAIVSTVYTLTANQIVQNFAVSGVNVVSLGTANITVGKNASNTDSFTFCVKNTNGNSKMTGNYYIGINVGSGEVIRAYTNGVDNYYKAYTSDDDHAAATSGDSIALASTTTITVTMYYAPVTPLTAEPAEKPLDDVTFQFKAEAPAPTA